MMSAGVAPDGWHVGREDATTRIGAIALPLGIILLVAATAIHPSREEVMDNLAVFAEYANSENWVAVHFVQWFAALLFIGGLVALYSSLTTKLDAAAGVARFGLAAALVTAAAITMLQAVDGVALKWAVDSWVSAPAEQEVAAFAAAQAVRWTEYGLQSYSNILLGLTLLLYGLAIALGAVYPRWLGWIAMGAGVAWIIHGLIVPYYGLFESMPRGVALVLTAVWAFVMAYLMWRTSDQQPIVPHQATSL
jgi:hypothetical protein